MTYGLYILGVALAIGGALSQVAIPETPAAASATGPATSTVRPFDFSVFKSPILLKGDEHTAYRDPLLMYHEGAFRMFFSMNDHKNDPSGKMIWRIASSTSPDLVNWSQPKLLQPVEKFQHVASPGSIMRYEGQWVLAIQTYPRDCHIFITRSKDLETWSDMELLQVKGPEVPVEKMGRQIDACIIADKDNPAKFYCFWKENGAGLATSKDLKTWEFLGHVSAGENVGMFMDGDDYVMVHSPHNGIGIKRSRDLKTWTKGEVLTLGQDKWEWAQGRLTAGYVLNLQNDPRFGKYVMVFHGNPGKGEGVNFTRNCSIGIAWSDDLKTWHWPGKETATTGSSVPR